MTTIIINKNCQVDLLSQGVSFLILDSLPLTSSLVKAFLIVPAIVFPFPVFKGMKNFEERTLEVVVEEACITLEVIELNKGINAHFHYVRSFCYHWLLHQQQTFWNIAV
jgi:tetrahydromethanopterin S-methyltransferase subunit C